MNHSHRMSGVQHTHDRFEHCHGFARSEVSASFQFRIEGVTFDILHHHVDHAVGCGAKIINSDGVGMTKAASGLALTTKTTQPLRIRTHFRRQNFYGDTIAEKNVAGSKDGPHAAFSEESFDVVLAVEYGAYDR